MLARPAPLCSRRCAMGPTFLRPSPGCSLGFDCSSCSLLGLWLSRGAVLLQLCVGAAACSSHEKCHSLQALLHRPAVATSRGAQGKPIHFTAWKRMEPTAADLWSTCSKAWTAGCCQSSLRAAAEYGASQRGTGALRKSTAGHCQRQFAQAPGNTCRLTSTVIREVSMKDLLKYCSAARASSAVRKPTKPNCRDTPSLQQEVTLKAEGPPQFAQSAAPMARTWP